MIILEKGTPPWLREHVASCSVCKTKIQFLEEEAMTRHDGYLKIPCPTCKSIITHDTKPRTRRANHWDDPR